VCLESLVLNHGLGLNNDKTSRLGAAGRGRARLGMALQGKDIFLYFKAGHGKARLGRARHCKARIFFYTSRLGKARQGRAGLGKARLGED